MDIGEPVDTIRQFVDEHELSFPALMDSGQLVTRAYQIRGVPTSLIIDRKGVIRHQTVGPLDDDKIKELVEPLL